MRTYTYFLAFMALSQVAGATNKKEDVKQHEYAVTGLVTINGKTYRATCNCPSNVRSLEDMVCRSRGLCHPSKIKIRVHGPHDPGEYKLVRDAFRLLPHEDFRDVGKFPLASMDGRVSGKAYYAPGGDLGLFIMTMLNHYDGASIPDQETVTGLLRQYIRQLPEGRGFYHATDTNALETIRKGLQWELLDITNIEDEHREKVKELIALGAHGDPFMKFLANRFRNHPAKKKLVLFGINAFFEIIWNKEDRLWEQLILELLEGCSCPSAVVEVSVSKGCELARMVPQVPARVGDKQLLIYTELAGNQRKKEMATFLHRQHLDKQRNAPLDEVVQHLDKFVHTLMEEFVSSNLDILHFYNVTLL